MVPVDQPSKPICPVLLLEPVEKSSRMAKTLASFGSKSRLPPASTASRSRGTTTPAVEVVATAGADQDAALLLLACSTLPLAAAPLTVTPLSTWIFRLGTSVVLVMLNGAVPVVTSDTMRVPASIVPVGPTCNCNTPLPCARRKVLLLLPQPMPKTTLPLVLSFIQGQ